MTRGGPHASRDSLGPTNGPFMTKYLGCYQMNKVNGL